MTTNDANGGGPPHHSRPDLFEAIGTVDQKTQVLKPNPRHVSTIIVDSTPLEEINETWHLGYRLDDRFEIIDIRGGKGSSGMGIVYIVEDGHGCRSAVKTLQRRFRRELHLLQRFIREARTWMLIGAHPNIVRADRLEIIEAAPCMFMELVASDEHGAHSVAQRLNRGPFSVAEALDLAHQFCAGMLHATRAVPGLVHRDIKPENLLIGPDGTLKITDFGLVRTKAMAEDSLEQWAQSGLFEDFSKDITRMGTIFGTPAYMAPEQFTRASDVDLRADIYAFGCCLYECLTGLPPFAAAGDSTVGRLLEIKRRHLSETPRPIREMVGDACPPGVEALVRRCLAKNPRDRWANYEDFSIAILSLMDSLGLSPRSIPAPSPSPADIAAQMRSITLLEGYDQAIHMKRLREGQEESPYAFHLALASYFHCVNDVQEEEAQLAKALSLRDQAAGYEAVRRLTELWIRQGHAARADVVLQAYLRQVPGALEQLLEPVVRAACASGQFEAALTVLEPFPDSFRTQLLHTEILRASGACDALRAMLETLQHTILQDLRHKLDVIQPGDVAGWGRASDPTTLAMVLEMLAPELDTDRLKSVSHAIWPDISGYPDFAPELAWLSYTLGELAALDAEAAPARAKSYAGYASMLGYPSRLEKHQERDEYWFWLRETQLGKPGD